MNYSIVFVARVAISIAIAGRLTPPAKIPLRRRRRSSSLPADRRRHASFILAAPYDLEAKIQKSDENITNSQLYRRCPAHMMTGMPDEYAQQLLSYAEEDFNIKLDEIVKNKLLQRIHQIKRGGLGVTTDILFRVLLVTIPDMKNFYQALMSDVDRNDALKLIRHKDPIRITEDVLLGAMSMQR